MYTVENGSAVTRDAETFLSHKEMKRIFPWKPLGNDRHAAIDANIAFDLTISIRFLVDSAPKSQSSQAHTNRVNDQQPIVILRGFLLWMEVEHLSCQEPEFTR